MHATCEVASKTKGDLDGLNKNQKICSSNIKNTKKRNHQNPEYIRGGWGAAPPGRPCIKYPDIYGYPSLSRGARSRGVRQRTAEAYDNAAEASENDPLQPCKTLAKRTHHEEK